MLRKETETTRVQVVPLVLERGAKAESKINIPAMDMHIDETACS
jgi:hypothetical protein